MRVRLTGLARPGKPSRRVHEKTLHAAPAGAEEGVYRRIRPIGPVHAGLQVLLRKQPQLLIELFIHAGVLPVETASWSVQLRPTEAIIICPGHSRRELRADVVLVVAPPELNIERGRARKRALNAGEAFAVIFEIQRVRDEERPEAWLDYLAAYRRDLGKAMRLVILTLDAQVAQWARKRTTRLEQLLKVFVVEPADCPRFAGVGDDPEPERAVLDAVLHARNETDLNLIQAAIAAIQGLEDDDLDDALHYEQMLIARLGHALIQRAMNADDTRTATMIPKLTANSTAADFENSPRPFFRLAVEVGHKKGLQVGQLEARAAVIIEILAHRGVAIDPDSRARVLACREPETLARWLGAALKVTDGAQLLAD